MFVRCSDCDWGQDDFWDPDGYMPFSAYHAGELMALIERALTDPFERTIDGVGGIALFTRDGLEDAPEKVDVRLWVASALRRAAARIDGMHWMTLREYREDPDKRCPKCGSSNLVED